MELFIGDVLCELTLDNDHPGRLVMLDRYDLLGGDFYYGTDTYDRSVNVLIYDTGIAVLYV